MDILKARERAREEEAKAKRSGAKKKSTSRKTSASRKTKPGKSAAKKKTGAGKTSSRKQPARKRSSQKSSASGGKSRGSKKTAPAKTRKAGATPPVAPEEMTVSADEFPTKLDVPEFAEIPTVEPAIPTLLGDEPAPLALASGAESGRPVFPEDMDVSAENFPDLDDIPEIAELPAEASGSGPAASAMLSLQPTSEAAPPVETPAAPPGADASGDPDQPESVPAPREKAGRKQDREHLQRLLRLLQAEDEFEEEEAYRADSGVDILYDPERAIILSFHLGQETYGLELDRVKEIIRMRAVTSVPRCMQSVVGVIALRGVIVPILDLRRRLGLETVESTKATRIIIVHTGDSLVGLRVDKVQQVVRIPRSHIEPSPPTMGGGLMEYVSGVARPEKKSMIILLNVDKVARLDRDSMVVPGEAAARGHGGARQGVSA